MKTLTITLATLLTSLTTLNLLAMQTIKTDIIINAPAEKVWQILLNHSEYPNWNPFIKSISGSVTPGDELNVTIQSEGNKAMNFTPLVLVNNENEEFRWIGKLGIKGIFDGEHYFILEQISPTETRFIHGENFKGILSGLFMKMIKEDTEKGFVSMNNALKRLAEK